MGGTYGRSSTECGRQGSCLSGTGKRMRLLLGASVAYLVAVLSYAAPLSRGASLDLEILPINPVDLRSRLGATGTKVLLTEVMAW